MRMRDEGFPRSTFGRSTFGCSGSGSMEFGVSWYHPWVLRITRPGAHGHQPCWCVSSESVSHSSLSWRSMESAARGSLGITITETPRTLLAASCAWKSAALGSLSMPYSANGVHTWRCRMTQLKSAGSRDRVSHVICRFPALRKVVLHRQAKHFSSGVLHSMRPGRLGDVPRTTEAWHHFGDRVPRVSPDGY